MNKILQCIIMVLLLLLLSFSFVRVLVSFQENTIVRNDNYCKLVYNATDSTSEPYFGRYCVTLNHTSKTITKEYYTHEEMMDYCGRIGFWELNKWGDKCSY